MNTPPKLVIFDCDGVLVDSEPTANRVLHDILTRQGATLTYAESCAEFTGKNRYAVIAYAEKHGITLPEKWYDEFYTTSIELLREHCQPIPDVKSVLDTLTTARVPFCVASNGVHPKMRATLSTTGLLPYFEGKAYSGYDVEHGKPAPDLFLHAAAQFDTDPADCVVVEDSATGLSAAAAAHMPAFAYDPSPQMELSGATAFKSMKELPKLLNL